MQEEDDIESLVSLGLTLVQSKVFLALSKSENATIGDISELSKVPRQDIYRTVQDLQELSLVEKLVTKPVRFQAIPMDEACTILLNRKRDEYTRLVRLQKNFVHNYNLKRQLSLRDRRDYEFCFVKGREALFKNIAENFRKSERRIDIATSQERLLQSLNYLGAGYKDCLEKGVKFRIITEKPQDTNSFLQDSKIIEKHSNVELKYVDTPLKAIAVIFDEKTALTAVTVGEPLLKSPIIFTNNPVFLTIFQEYFENIWKTGKHYHKKSAPLTGNTSSSAFNKS
jgi:sugar-specific transcriptional regulator TrmB